MLLTSLLLSACTSKPENMAQGQTKIIQKVAASAEKKHYYGYAASLRTKIQSTNPNDFNNMHMLAADLRKAGNWQKSLYYLAKLSAKQPNNKQVQLEVAHAYLHLKAWQLAFKQYQQILLTGGNVSAYNGMSVLLNASKHYQAANQCLDLALKLAPDDPNTNNNKALTLALMGDKANALEILNKLILLQQAKVYHDNFLTIKHKKNLWQHIFRMPHKLNISYSCK